VELLNYLNSSSFREWKISNVENIDNMFDSDEKRRLINKEAIYKNYKILLVDTRKLIKKN
jgi:hypothetical protein